MTDIDWSKAPQGATHYMRHGGDYLACWIKKGDTGRLDAILDDGKDNRWGFAGNYRSKKHLLTARPQPPTWSGTGLPPVGTVCEFFRLDDCQKETLADGATVKIIAHYDGMNGQRVAAFTYDHRYGRDVESAVSECFRPIRTPEQIEADEREAAIEEMKKLFDSVSDLLMPTSNSYLNILFGAMYDAGCRKP
jgi:hypothetical protein